MGPLGIVFTVFGLLVHFICGMLNARMWWGDWKRSFVYTSDNMDLAFIIVLSILLGVFSIIGRLWCLKVVPKLVELFEKIPDISIYMGGEK